MSVIGVRRAKAALSSGCKSRPATAPAGSNRSSHGGNEVAEAFGYTSNSLATSPASIGVSAPSAAAVRTAAIARLRRRPVLRSSAARNSLDGLAGGGTMRSMHSLRACMSPAFESSIALRVKEAASPSRRASIASDALLRDPTGENDSATTMRRNEARAFNIDTPTYQAITWGSLAHLGGCFRDRGSRPFVQ